jgi:hypothetical protein
VEVYPIQGDMLVNVLPIRSDEPINEPTFDDFWLLYPRRIAKKEAARAWSKVRPDDRSAALVALVNWRRVWASRGDDQFTPYPATWLNGERWTDELPREFLQTNLAHRPAPASVADGPRAPIPEHVRSLLAKLRGAK